MAVDMAIAKDGHIVMKKWLHALGEENTTIAGQKRSIDGRIRRMWISKGSTDPSGAAPTGMLSGDFILHVSDDSSVNEAWIYEGGTTYTEVSTSA